jgi:uncharacterized small protein (DUF1192 family)
MDIVDLDDKKRSDALAALLGEDLSLMSIEELNDRVDLLQSEILRVSQMAESKKGSRQEAEAFFKQ